jgi:hypothetical protein
MPNFKIFVRWTQKGLDEIDEAPDRRAAAIKLMQTFVSDAGAPLITFTNGGASDTTGSQDIKYLVDNTSHVVWTVTGAKADVVDLASGFEFHEYVKCRVAKA